MDRNEFRNAVAAIARKNVLDQGQEPTDKNVEAQMLWLAALHEAQGISECWTLKDIAQALLTGGIPATNLEEWITASTDEDADPGEVLDNLRLF
jgi:hypothetical protein